MNNSKITIEDMNFAEKVFDSNIGFSKSKTTRRRLISISSDIFDIPNKLLRVSKEVSLENNRNTHILSPQKLYPIFV